MYILYIYKDIYLLNIQDTCSNASVAPEYSKKNEEEKLAHKLWKVRSCRDREHNLCNALMKHKTFIKPLIISLLAGQILRPLVSSLSGAKLFCITPMTTSNSWLLRSIRLTSLGPKSQPSEARKLGQEAKAKERVDISIVVFNFSGGDGKHIRDRVDPIPNVLGPICWAAWANLCAEHLTSTKNRWASSITSGYCTCFLAKTTVWTCKYLPNLPEIYMLT